MWRFLFSLSFLAGLFVLVPWLARATRSVPQAIAYELSAPDATLDVDRLRATSRNRALAVATDDDVLPWRAAPLSKFVEALQLGSERERRVVAALLGASGHPDAVKPLIHAFEQALERDDDPRTIAALASALAESRRREAILALIAAIRDEEGLGAHEASRALRVVFGVSFGQDAQAWSEWLRASGATRD